LCGCAATWKQKGGGTDEEGNPQAKPVFEGSTDRLFDEICFRVESAVPMESQA
jgi:hypothetical protein